MQAPISMIYAMRESLKLICEEGLTNVWARHRKNAGVCDGGMGSGVWGLGQLALYC
jgi:alanine-glyoxylate transaminase/serine-glyoxylate transaminase/serine-pyruvate transaminase